MLKKLVIIGMCLGSLSIEGTSDLKKAVDNLDVEAVVKILDESPSSLTDNEIIRSVSELTSAIEDVRTNRLMNVSFGALIGFLAGFYVFEGRGWARDFVRSRFWAREDRATVPGLLNNDGRVVAVFSTLTAMVIGAYGSSYFWPKYDIKKALTILDLLPKYRRTNGSASSNIA